MAKKRERKTALGVEDSGLSETVTKTYPGKERVKIITVKTVVPRKCHLFNQDFDFKKDETRVLRSDKIKFLDEILARLTQSDYPVVKILEVKEE